MDEYINELEKNLVVLGEAMRKTIDNNGKCPDCGRTKPYHAHECKVCRSLVFESVVKDRQISEAPHV